MSAVQPVTVSCQTQHSLTPMKAWLRKAHPDGEQGAHPFPNPFTWCPLWIAKSTSPTPPCLCSVRLCGSRRTLDGVLPPAECSHTLTHIWAKNTKNYSAVLHKGRKLNFSQFKKAKIACAVVLLFIGVEAHVLLSLQDVKKKSVWSSHRQRGSVQL